MIPTPPKCPTLPGFYQDIDNALTSYFESQKWKEFVFWVMASTQITDPKAFQFITDVLAIILVITNGQRPQAAELIEVSDLRAMHVNKCDESLFTIPVQVEKDAKDGKRASQIYLGVDADMKSLLLKFLDLRLLFIQNATLEHSPSTLFFNAKSGQSIAMKNIYNTLAWRDLGFPEDCNITSFRQAVATFFCKDEVSKTLDPNVLQNHSSEIRKNTYYTAGMEDFEMGHSRLRQKFIPHSAAIPKDMLVSSTTKETEEQSKFQMALKTSIQERFAKNKAKARGKRSPSKWSISSEAKFLLIKNIISAVDLKTSVLMLKDVPTDTASKTVKPWTSMISRFLLHPENKVLLELLAKELHPDSFDPAGELSVSVRHCLYDFNRGKGIFYFAAPKRTI